MSSKFFFISKSNKKSKKKNFQIISYLFCFFFSKIKIKKKRKNYNIIAVKVFFKMRIKIKKNQFE